MRPLRQPKRAATSPFRGGITLTQSAGLHRNPRQCRRVDPLAERHRPPLGVTVGVTVTVYQIQISLRSREVIAVEAKADQMLRFRDRTRDAPPLLCYA
jgi:hypothetical protein